MTGHLDQVIALVTAHGGDPEATAAAVVYLAERTAGLSVATAHSSPHSSPRFDTYLRSHLRLTGRQIGALLCLIRGSRAVRRGSSTVGGHPSMVAVLATGTVTPADRRRFERLARIAAGSPPDTRAGCATRVAPAAHPYRS